MIIDTPENRPLPQYPRNIVLAAEQYMKDSGIADTMLILPEFEFYLFDEVTWNVQPQNIGMTLDANVTLAPAEYPNRCAPPSTTEPSAPNSAPMPYPGGSTSR